MEAACGQAAAAAAARAGQRRSRQAAAAAAAARAGQRRSRAYGIKLRLVAGQVGNRERRLELQLLRRLLLERGVLFALLAQATVAAALQAAGERALRRQPPLPLGAETSLPLRRILMSCRLVAERLVDDLVQRATWRRADDRAVDVDPVWAGRVVVNPAVKHAPALAGWRLAAWPSPADLHPATKRLAPAASRARSNNFSAASHFIVSGTQVWFTTALNGRKLLRGGLPCSRDY